MPRKKKAERASELNDGKPLELEHLSDENGAPLTIGEALGFGRPAEYTWARHLKVCETIAECGQKYLSCELNGFHYETVLTRMNIQSEHGDERWRQAWNSALERYRDNLENEARRRAWEGVKTPVFHQGKIVGHVQKHSDRLMESLLRAERPEKFRDNVKMETEVTGGVLVVPERMSVEEFMKQHGGDGDDK